MRAQKIFRRIRHLRAAEHDQTLGVLCPQGFGDHQRAANVPDIDAEAGDPDPGKRGKGFFAQHAPIQRRQKDEAAGGQMRLGISLQQPD